MDQSWVDNMDMPSTSNSQPLLPHFPAPLTLRHGNVFRMLALREISPGTKRLSKRLWGSSSNQLADCSGPKWGVTDTRKGLISWVEAESLRHLSAKYCPLLPPPRSTIAAAFSPDGKTLASTHGDHTVKIIDCQTGSCLKVLSGHRRTPWVVRFHPVHSEILASGSLDHEVRLWDSNTADCIGSRDFYRPIASIAFHAHGELLAVASGHKLYIWHYNRRGETASPTIILKTRRSLRAVHFHPHAAPFLLTAEVNDLNAPDSPMSLATSPGYLQYPPPAVFFANVKTSVLPSLEARVPFMPFPSLFLPTFVRSFVRTSFQNDNRATGAFIGQQTGDSSASAQLHAELNTQNQHDYLVTAMDMSPVISSSSNPVAEDATTNYLRSEMENADAALESSMDPMETTEAEPIDAVEQRSSPNSAEKSDDANNTTSVTPQLNGIAPHLPSRHSRLGAEVTSGLHMSTFTGNPDHQMLLRSVEVGQLDQIFPSADPAFWELPFLQGWLMGHTHAGLHPAPSINATTLESFPAVRVNRPDNSGTGPPASRGLEASPTSSAMANNVSQSRGTGRSGSRHRSRSRLVTSTGSVEGAASISIVNDEVDPHSGVGRLDSELATSLAAAAAAELPCTVKLRIWAHNIQDPCAPLDAEKCRLTIPHAVLCSEMGAHFSPCGRFLAACVACVLPRMEADPGLPLQVQQDVSGLATSPTRHPISAHQVMYELRIYSLEKATFGLVLASRAIRAAHCLTSIQFSPTSEHILLAYGRRHSSLLRSIVVDGETTIPIYTILEVYRVSDMELVRVLPSAEDEVNVACFHPLGGGGLVYGTKEGKLRILQYDSPHGTNCTGSNFFLEENMLEVPTYALEC